MNIFGNHPMPSADGVPAHIHPQPVTHNPELLTAQGLIEIYARIVGGFYDNTAVTLATAQQLLTSGDLNKEKKDSD